MSGDEARDEVGVGPWPGGPAAWPRLPDGAPDPRYDPELLAHGDRRNVVDRYRYRTVEAVVADLDARRPAGRQLHVAIENWAHDLNIGSVVRTANAFNAAGVHVVGRRRWNRRGAMVTDRYLHVHHHPDAAALVAWAAGVPAVEPVETPATGIPVIGIDNVPGSVPLEAYDLPARCVLLFGQESTGLTPEAQEACADVLHITQHGSTRSLNAGAAGAIAMHAWASRWLSPTTS
ncbi:TrmH family RNA methyltransferase [Krasilnikoviella flava]|uniref:tRNA G18 (Ribose-2'-O)-methylase SpoU n=1 Tax=Krasilnikoviella flava TaxID=526729 RepID=A0A1T5LJ65_9MICO|nr:RNA methyltransferase [Krasilnikoviella flava]SKC76022.1 tRNA G18 (ribose-2'-O)-methylase SpoU [Krasilnikoviella flava]